MAKGDKMAQVRLPSGEVRMVPMNCKATVGQVENIDHENVHIGKAGRKRHMGIRPGVRGSAMNPVDHPHGGGEGKAPIGLPSLSRRGVNRPWVTRPVRRNIAQTSTLSSVAAASRGSRLFMSRSVKKGPS